MVNTRLVFRAPYQAVFEEVAIPRVGEREILVRAVRSGISVGTELTLFRGVHPNLTTKKWGYWTSYPIYPGYELAGVVEAVGSGVSGFRVGDRVISLAPHQSWAIARPESTATLPESVSYDEALTAVLATTTMHAIRRAAIEYGDTVAVVGVGVVGLLALQHAKLAGARRVIAIDTNEQRLQLAREVAADEVFNPVEGQPDFGETGPDVVIEAAGNEAALRSAIEYVRDRGRVVVLGYHAKPETYLLGDDFYHKELLLIATRATGPKPGMDPSYVRWTSETSLRYAVELIGAGKIHASCMLGPVLPWDELPALYDRLDAGELGGAGLLRVDWKAGK